MPLGSDPNVQDYKYPTFILSLVDQWGSGYAVLVQGYGNVADDQRIRDMLSGLHTENRVNWASCRKLERAEETSDIFPSEPPAPMALNNEA